MSQHDLSTAAAWKAVHTVHCGLVSCTGFYLSLHTCMIHERPGICCEATHCCTYVDVDLCNFLNAAGLLHQADESQWRLWAGDVATSLLWLLLMKTSCIGIVVLSAAATVTALTSKGEVIRFSTASTTPSFVCTPTAVEPSCRCRRLENSQPLASQSRADSVCQLRPVPSQGGFVP